MKLDVESDFRRLIMAKVRRGGQGGRGACGGVRRRDGSGGGVGNRGTKRQPPKKRK